MSAQRCSLLLVLHQALHASLIWWHMLQEGQDLSRTYLAHHELENVAIFIVVIVVVIIVISIIPVIIITINIMMQEPSLLRNAIAFYRLLATWLMRMAFPPLTHGQMPFVPLPDPAPIQFRCLPVRPHPCHGCTP